MGEVVGLFEPMGFVTEIVVGALAQSVKDDGVNSVKNI